MATVAEVYQSPAVLVAILVAAHRVGDRELERMTREQLEDSHGVRIRFLGRSMSDSNQQSERAS